MIQLSIGYLLSIAMLIVLSDHSKGQNVSKRTMGGDFTSVNEFRHHVAIETNVGGGVEEYFQYSCGGSIIHVRWVLTAAHCLYNDFRRRIHIKNIRVLAGIQNLDLPYHVLRRSDLIFYPEEGYVYRYHAQIELAVHNIALLRFKARTFNRLVNGLSVKIVKMSFDIPPPKQTYFTVGYFHRSILTKITVPTLNTERCYKTYGRMFFDFDWHICAGYLDGKEAPCKSDAGGGLVSLVDSEYRLHGIINDETCGLFQTPGRYTSIYYYLNWIVRTINKGRMDRYREPTANQTSTTRW